MVITTFTRESLEWYLAFKFEYFDVRQANHDGIAMLDGTRYYFGHELLQHV